jgi:hypothetical protein
LIVQLQMTGVMPLLGARDSTQTPYGLLHQLGKSLEPQHVESVAAAGALPAHWPVQGDLLEWCRSAGPGLAVILILCGIVFLLFGYSIFKVLVTLNAAVLGGYVGMLLGERTGVEVPAAIIGAMLAATAAWPTMRYSVAIMGGLFGAVLGVTLWRLSNLDPAFGWSGGMTGMVFFGLLSFLLFRECIITYTSLQGSVMLVFGILGLVFKYQEVGGPLSHHFQIKPFLLPLAIFIPTLGGFIYQKAMIPGAPAPAPAKK